MNASFYTKNRHTLYESLPEDTVLCVYAGGAIRKTADEDYPVYTDTNFLYLTGIEQAESVLFAVRHNGETKETLFTLPPDFIKERWTGKRIKPDAASAVSGIADIRSTDELDAAIKDASGFCRCLALDIDDMGNNNPTRLAFQGRVSELAPALTLHDIRPQLRRQRTVKAPCEIDAMRRAESLTTEGITAMMLASAPGMYEYQYKAVWDHTLLMKGCREPAFPSIISAGENNFCIHYYDYRGQARDGDMILNDVGAKYDHMHTDVSRGWPCNGKFSERQRALYECAYKTSNHMFETLRPGLPMKFVDKEIHRYCGGLLCELGLLDSPENESRYMWHGGSHHVGFDTHDMVDASGDIAPGWVFCVDVGIYVPEWGIGFRLEDNCLITEDGCENLSIKTPRSIDDIEAVMM